MENMTIKNLNIETERLTLKSPLGIVNARDIVKAIDDEETKRYLSSVPNIYTEETAESFLKFLAAVNDSKDTIQLGIFHKSTDTLIGMIALEDINYEKRSCELGYWVSKEFTGKGLAYEASRAMLDIAVNGLKMDAVYAYVIKEHIKSTGLLQRLGFIEKELLVNNVENKGQLVDRLLYVLNKNI